MLLDYMFDWGSPILDADRFIKHLSYVATSKATSVSFILHAAPFRERFDVSNT